MIKEILKIKPRVDDGDLGKMERTLNTRFARVAKKFGSGLVNVVKGAGIVGLVVGFLDKLLNPLKETQDAIERMISQGDDIVTNAEAFGTTAGKLFKLTKFANAAGLENDGLFTLLTKYQSAVAEAKSDPSKPSAVLQFANDEDIAESFFAFIQSLKSLSKSDKTKAVRVQNEVFGEKQTLKYADFLGQDFGQLNKNLQLRSADAYTAPLTKLGNLKDLDDQLKARREANDIFAKAALINQGMIESNNASAQRELQLENDRIAAYKDLKAVSETMAKMLALLEKLTQGLGKLITFLTPFADDLIKYVKAIAFARGTKGMGRGE